MQTQSPQTENNFTVKLVHATKQHSPEDPVQLAFAVTDPETGNEQILTAQIPFAADLYELCYSNGWVQRQGSGISNIRRRSGRAA